MKISATLTLIAVLFTACISVGAQSRQAADQFEVSEFTAIESSVIANIHIKQSPTVSVTAEGSEELLNLLDVRMDNDKLILTMEDRHLRRNKGRSEKLLISISTPTLTRLDFDGVGNIEIDGAFSTPELTIDSEGVGNLRADRLEAGSIYISSQGVGNTTLGGKTDKLEIKSEGVGNVNTTKLTSRSAVVTSQGVGNVNCHASEYLKVRSEGIGNVTYYGNPVKKELNKEGLGKIKAGN
ncbi:MULTISPECIES: head GIN domain-containing protein [Proteiniphilum]|uniref:head GIN domain-containing protein n=1 Tax=Proteiniphilum TaxID=294702 RepID=UPI00037E798A|nr:MULTISPECIES: head GIN domain-containing protein [Proteiniphilum]SFL51515.1 Putative auto-transporter adhesin, head GIN domain [Porphyromonadaceae bacterium KH3CP3RA]